MKISKSFLSRIIKEEIKNILYEDHAEWEISLAQYFVHIRDLIDQGKGDVNREKFIKHIKNLTGEKDYTKIVKYMDGKVDNNLYGTVAELLINQKPNVPAQLPNSYKDTDPRYKKDMSDLRNPYETASAPTYNRKPLPIPPQDQEDTRKDRFGKDKKNLVH